MIETVLNRDEVIRRESWIRGGWNLRDDEALSPPDLDPLASAQARRAARLDDQQADVISAP